MSEEQEIHPFIKKYRAGTTERITSFDPSTEEFHNSIAYNSDLVSGDGIGQNVPVDVFASIMKPTLSQLSNQIDKIGNSRLTGFGAIGRPWNSEGFVQTKFNTQTGILTDTSSGLPEADPLGFDRAKLLMEYWTRREPEFESAWKIAKKPVLTTLVNKFVAIPDQLICYSFLVKFHGTGSWSGRSELHIIHVWINRNYMIQGRQLPMYFEHGGTSSLFINAAVSSMGFRVDPMGFCYLEVTVDDGTWKMNLSRSQIDKLTGLGVMPILFNSDSRLAVTMMNSNLEGLGFTLSSTGRQWTLAGSVTDWRIAHAISGVTATPISRAGWTPTDLIGTGAARKENPGQNAHIVADLVNKAFWGNLAVADNTFAPIISALRKEVFSRSIIKEVRKVTDDAFSATELLRLYSEKSDELGRFDFERNLPGVKTEAKPVADVEAQSSRN